MKSYLLSLLICFASTHLCLARYYTDEQQVTCLHNNGLNNSTDIDLVREFLRSDNDQEEFRLEKEFTCALSCILNSVKRTPHDNIYEELTYIINIDDQIPGELKRGMKYLLDRCHKHDEGEDCKLLNCIRILRPPFKQALDSLQ